jgi:cytochrome c peroxidase
LPALSLIFPLSAQQPYHFPIVGVGPGQTLLLSVVALGTKQMRCRGTLALRDANGEPTGSTRSFDLALGGSQILHYFSTPGTRTDVRPYIEVSDDPSSCYAAFDLQPGASTAFMAAVRRPPVHPADSPFASFVQVESQQKLRITATHIERPEAPCRVTAQLRDSRGRILGLPSQLAPEPGKAVFIEANEETLAVPEGQTARIQTEVSPIDDGSGAGCLITAEIISALGNTNRIVPVAVRQSVEAPVAPPSRSRAAAMPTAPASSAPIGDRMTPRPPLGLPPLPVPDDNPLTAQTAALGRRLYYDPVLSRDATVACASCHDPAAAFRDPRRVSQGVNGLDGDRQSMTIFNAAYAKEVFWDGRAPSLERQAFGPVESGVEFAFSHRGVERRLEQDPTYVEQFAQAFGPGPITYEKAAKSIAAFQRTVLSGNSRFDRFQYGGDRTALSISAQNGIGAFSGGGCTNCHAMSAQFSLFSDDQFHNTGVAALAFDRLSDQGRWKVTGKESDRGAFRTMSLRNVTQFSRLMHNGTLGMGNIPDFYGRGGNRNQWISPLLPILGPASPQTIQSLSDFLDSLTGETPENVGPPE